MDKKLLSGNFYVYARSDREPAIAYTHAMGRDIPDWMYYTDNPRETTQLEALFRTVSAGDTVIVGTITDFMLTDIQELMDILENLDEADVKVLSRLEPDYDINLYRPALRIADKIYRIKMGEKPF